MPFDRRARATIPRTLIERMNMAATPKAPSIPWQSRIVGEGDESPDQLLANPLNFRTHPAEQAAALTGGLDTIGWITRVVVNRRSGHVIDGHLRVAQALKRGETSVPVTYVDLSDDEERIALATLDPISAMAGQDDAILRELLTGLEVDNEALAMHLAQLMPDGDKGMGKGDKDPDAVPLIPARVRSRRGELWALGEHRLIIDDSTDAATIARLMQGSLANAVWTDPPYNVDYQGSDGQKLANDKMESGKFRAFLRAMFHAALQHTMPGGPIYVAHADSEGLNFRAALIDAGWLAKQCLVWVKNSFTLGRQDYQWQHEPILYGWKPGSAHYWHGERNKATVLDDRIPLEQMDRAQLLEHAKALTEALNPTIIDCPKPTRNDLHPTMKPVALLFRTLGNSLLPGERVLDVCGGSGSTLIAAEMMGATAHLAELDPVYADIIIQRWQTYTGGQALRVGDDQLWDDLPTRAATEQTEEQARE